MFSSITIADHAASLPVHVQAYVCSVANLDAADAKCAEMKVRLGLPAAAPPLDKPKCGTRAEGEGGAQRHMWSDVMCEVDVMVSLAAATLDPEVLKARLLQQTGTCVVCVPGW